MEAAPEANENPEGQEWVSHIFADLPPPELTAVGLQLAGEHRPLWLIVERHFLHCDLVATTGIILLDSRALCTTRRSFCISSGVRGMATRLVPVVELRVATNTAAEIRLIPPGVCIMLLTILLISN